MAELADRLTSGRTRAADDQDMESRSLELDLLVSDPETVEALLEHPAGEARDQYALAALKIGVQALRWAAGRLDSDLIRQESSRLLESMDERLQTHTRTIHDRLSGELKHYFDPQDGRFAERVERLVRQDGELEQILRRQIGSDDSQLAKTLVAHFGEQSPLMKMLSPDQSRGLLAALRESLEEQLCLQRDRLLKEFSLDNQEGSLARLVAELTKTHGQLSEDLRGKIDEVVKEFSLDEENSALSRLVRNVDAAQRTISAEFSLDNEDSAFSRLNAMLRETQGAIHKNLTLDSDDSPLSRLKRELLAILDTHWRANREFQEQVKVSLEKMAATRAEVERSTRHGNIFEEALCALVQHEAQKVGDVAAPTGSEVGLIKNCKVGDCVVELGPDSVAPGAKIVVEAKEMEGYTLVKAREEIELARKNRGCQIGLFVYSGRCAPATLEPLARYGQDLVVVWDAENPATDVYLRAALIIARALCIRSGQQSQAQTEDFEAIERAILDIEKRAKNLEEISTSAQTIHSASDKILTRARIDRQELTKQVECLREHLAALKCSLGQEAAAD